MVPDTPIRYICIAKFNNKQKRMMTSNEVAKVYDTLLCIPGMNYLVKLDLKVSRKQILLLTQVTERGLKE